MKKNFFYLQPDIESLFANAGLDNFDALWRADAEPVDVPNVARGGRSEVGVLALQVAGEQHRFYIKRQQNFNCRIRSRPWQAIPVALREWLNITNLERAGIATLEVACVGRRVTGNDEMILVTRALDEYTDMLDWLHIHTAEAERAAFFSALGRQVARLHNAGYMHGCCYPKHVYVGHESPQDIRLIDLEKCRKIFSARGGLRDLDTLLRRYNGFQQGEKRCLLESYIRHAEFGWTLVSLQKVLGIELLS